MVTQSTYYRAKRLRKLGVHLPKHPSHPHFCATEQVESLNKMITEATEK